MIAGNFDALSPMHVITCVEASHGLLADGMVQAFSSYVNRVYGLQCDDQAIIAKFYRPGRWSEAAIREEHQFLADCHVAELPVVAPLLGLNGETLFSLKTEQSEIRYALFPKRAGRQFDAERTDDWLRLGRLVGRMHQIGQNRQAPNRVRCHPLDSGANSLQELYDSQTVHSEVESEFFDVCEAGIEDLIPAFKDIAELRIHGDCHRGNIFDRPGDGLLLLDFDDMMWGPAVQDLWLLLPGRMDQCQIEFNLVLEGYGEFMTYNPAETFIVEGLRLMRMLHYLAWCARQRDDQRFLESFPDWGGRAFWIKELEDFRLQARIAQAAVADAW